MLTRKMAAFVLAATTTAAAVVLSALFAFNTLSIDRDANGEDRDHQVQQQGMQQSLYLGQETRAIKALSDSDIESLQNGTGEAFDGMAKPAELNGYPGPRHVLDIKSELSLEKEQESRIAKIYHDMNRQAKSLGAEILGIEAQIDSSFAAKTASADSLSSLLDKSAHLYGQLRNAHQSAHLETADVLTPEQIRLYGELRGYHQQHDKG